ncbi:MAG: cob(I)yrinic acid a,c-diamide adenosyltransferase [Bacteroidales bacterium]|jgi:cob(I)alamin adenosyltransferase|nr:cob(I)yrinic acid a,c-diamide adenosyltransferase [Bacteroidales bacterium]
MDWKIYTKSGDKGQTALIGGSRVPKYHQRIEAYGTIDELKSYIGLIRDISEDEDVRTLLFEIQDRLFTAESLIAADSLEAVKGLPKLFETDVEILEKSIDNMNESLPELSSFIMPGGHPLASHTHIARTICRRAERITIKTAEEFAIDPLCVKYLNRLSDFLFVLARKFAFELGGNEIKWKPRRMRE